MDFMTPLEDSFASERIESRSWVSTGLDLPSKGLPSNMVAVGLDLSDTENLEECARMLGKVPSIDTTVHKGGQRVWLAALEHGGVV